MDVADVNGGNADAAIENSNLQNVESETPDFQESEEKVEDIVKMEIQEMNGDIKASPKRSISTVAKRKLRKFKANSTSTIETESSPKLKGRKRKFSEPDDLSSEESSEFNGFDAHETSEIEPLGTNVLNKLIEEAEFAEAVVVVQHNRNSSAKTNSDSKDDKNDEESFTNRISHGMDSTLLDVTKIKRDSETESIDIPTNFESDTGFKMEETSSLSANSSPSGVLHKFKGNLMSRSISPSTPGRQKASSDISNPAFKEPFKYGWKRELVYRTTYDSSMKKMADIYYYTPQGKKVRSFREVAQYLHTKELNIDNFTFFKEPIGLNDPLKEIIRDAKKPKGVAIVTPTPTKKKAISNKVKKKSSPPKKQAKLDLPVVTPIIKSEPVEPVPAPVPILSPALTKTPTRSPKTQKTGPKAKVPPKRTPQIKIKTEPVESPATPATVPKRSQPVVEKSSPPKSKKLLTRKQNRELDRQHFMTSVCAGYHALLRIFQYLKVQELLRAARVCKMWRDLAAHPSLWKTVRMKNSQVTDWDGLADTLQRKGTQHLDLRKMLVAGESDNIWKKFLTVIPRVTSLVKLELCRCPVMVVEEVIKSCPQLEVLSALMIKCDFLNLESVGNLKRCKELRLKAINGMSLQEDLTPLQGLTQLTQLSLTSVKELGKKKIEVIQSLVNLEALDLGECSDFPDKFGTTVLIKLQKLERLRLEKGQGSCCTFDILEGVSKLEKLSQMELVNFDVKNGFDKYLANCKNIKRLLIIPTYISQSATSNNMVLGGVTELSNNLTHFVWGVTLELLRVTELFIDQCNFMSKQVTGDSIPVLKPVPCLKLIEDVDNDNDNQRGNDKQSQLTSPQVDILPLPQLQKLLLTALPKTRVKILKIPFHATWRQNISDTTTQ